MRKSEISRAERGQGVARVACKVGQSESKLSLIRRRRRVRSAELTRPWAVKTRNGRLKNKFTLLGQVQLAGIDWEENPNAAVSS